MAAASPSRFASSFLANSQQHWAPGRTYTRPNTHQRSPVSVLDTGNGFSANAPALQSLSYGDSSDEDIPRPMNFSALTKAILERDPAAKGPSPHRSYRNLDLQSDLQQHEGTTEAHARARSSPRVASANLRVRRSPQPATTANTNYEESSPHRVVHLSGSRPTASLKRSTSALERSAPMSRASRDSTPLDTNTPGQSVKRAPLYSRTSSASSADRHASQTDSALRRETRATTRSRDVSVERRADDAAAYQSGRDSSEPPQSYSQTRSRSQTRAQTRAQTSNSQPEPAVEPLASSVRVRKPIAGSLRSKPLRRGARRRNSDELMSPMLDDAPSGFPRYESDQQDAEVRPSSRSGSASRPAWRSIERNESMHDGSASRNASRPADPVAVTRSNTPREHDNHLHRSGSSSKMSSRADHPEKVSAVASQPVFKLPALPPMDSMFDQENEPPPTFKRNKPQTSSMLLASEKLAAQKEVKAVEIAAPTHADASPKRVPLAKLDQNTPLRPAPPPPPKMSVVDAATTSAGASTVKSKKKRNGFVVNGKFYSNRGRVGTGGSSVVYRVQAENEKLFALKRVNLADCNEDTVRGYLGEIKLLMQLKDEGGVVQLLDSELNEQKQTLQVVMEVGDCDFNKLLMSRLQADDARLDLSFVRHYWRELVTCVARIHRHDIVHSDLKPANYLLVAGRLKLIDFGIANAIDTDVTVNVHRETGVGTPNYMSPESIEDDHSAAGAGGARIKRFSKPSDIWSLGCILYQMVYSKPPFAHIPNQMARCQAIINRAVPITFPTTGIGGAPVPLTLRRVLQRCLTRDAIRRPTAAQLLDDREPFLNPDPRNDNAVLMSEDVLAQILQKVVDRCRQGDRGTGGVAPLTDADIKGYPRVFMEKIRAGMEKGYLDT